MPVKILLVDDHLVFSSSLKIVLETRNYEVESVTDANLGLKYLKSTQFDLVITDIDMPNLNGVDFIKEINNINNYKQIKIIVLTSFKKLSLFKKLYSIGIDGYLSKNTSQFELFKAISHIISNEKYYESNIYNAFLKADSSSEDLDFTPREIDVLKLILDEKTTSEIAIALEISPYTVEGHRKNLLQKTNSKNVVGLIKYSLNNNLF